MPNLFEQLEKAEREREYIQRQSKRQHSGLKKQLQTLQPNRQDALRSPSLEVEEEMITLYRNIHALLPDHNRQKIIQFTSIHANEGTPVIVRELAKVAAVKLNQTVLLVDMDPLAAQFNYFGMTAATTWKDAILEERPFQEVHYQVGDSLLHMGHVAINRDSITQILHSPWIDSLFDELRKEYDMVFIDSPPMSESSDSLTLAEKADGIVLVIECSKTRWQSLVEIKNNIAMRGGMIVGVVLNKKRDYIPKFLYDRL